MKEYFTVFSLKSRFPDDVIKWNHFYWPFVVRGIHPSPVNTPRNEGVLHGVFPWKADFLMTLLNEIICRVTGPLWGGIHPTGEFPSQKPMKRSFGVFFDMHLNNREAGDFKRNHTHYDVIVIWPKYATILIEGVACICAFELFEGKRS